MAFRSSRYGGGSAHRGGYHWQYNDKLIGSFTSEQPDHTHTLTIGAGSAHSHTFTTASNGNHTHTVTVNNNGSGNAHNNMQPSLVVNFIIKF